MGFRGSSQGPPHLSVVRQCHSNGLHNKTGRHERQSIAVFGSSDSVLGRRQLSIPDSGTPKGRPESSSRLLKQGKSARVRVEPEYTSILDAERNMGNSPDQPIRIMGQHKGVGLFLPEHAGSSKWSGRASAAMDLLPVLCFPPFSDDPVGAQETAKRVYKHDFSSTFLAQEGMVFNPAEDGSRTPLVPL